MDLDVFFAGIQDLNNKVKINKRLKNESELAKAQRSLEVYLKKGPQFLLKNCSESYWNEFYQDNYGNLKLRMSERLLFDLDSRQVYENMVENKFFDISKKKIPEFSGISGIFYGNRIIRVYRGQI